MTEQKIWIPWGKFLFPLSGGPAVREFGGTFALEFKPSGQDLAYFELEIPDHWQGEARAEISWTANAEAGQSVVWSILTPSNAGAATITDTVQGRQLLHKAPPINIALDSKHLTLCLTRADQSDFSVQFFGVMISKP
jgi:hypothetical protein